jgi:hypothetical protein
VFNYIVSASFAHKIRNLEAKVPTECWREVKGHALAAYQALNPKLAVGAGSSLPLT